MSRLISEDYEADLGKFNVHPYRCLPPSQQFCVQVRVSQINTVANNAKVFWPAWAPTEAHREPVRQYNHASKSPVMKIGIKTPNDM